MKSVNLVVVGDHILVRTGISTLLRNLGAHLIAEVTSEQEARRVLDSHRKNTILLDIVIPQIDRLEAIQNILADYPNVRVMIVALQFNEEYAWQALRAGATGYLQNDAGLAELEMAIRAVAKGQTYVSPSISKHVVGKYVRQKNNDVISEKLTPRQQQILKMVVEGLSTREVAQRLSISIRTVETHRFQLMERLGIRNVAGLVRFAIQSGLIKQRSD